MNLRSSLKAIGRKLKSYIYQNQRTMLIIGLVYMIYRNTRQKSLPERLKLSYFLLLLSSDLVKEVVVGGNKQLLFNTSQGDTWYRADASMLSKDRLYKLLASRNDIVFDSQADHTPAQGDSPSSLFLQTLIGCTTGYLTFMLVQHFTSAMDSPTQHQLYTKYYFSDIYGMEEAKKELLEIVEYLKDPLKYQAIGARLRKGVLIYGPPGTGKTLLAKATAGECQANFIYSSASEFIEMYVGVGAKRIRNIFKQAREQQPAIIFIDEIDGIGGKRNRDGNDQHDSERNNTLNQLLTEIDGFIENQNIVVMAATNRIQSLDDALVRSGRFDSKIQVFMPNYDERKGIIQLHLSKKSSIVKEDMIQQIADKTGDFSGADLENLVNESAYVAIGQKRINITDQDIVEAFKKVKSQKQYRRQ